MAEGRKIRTRFRNPPVSEVGVLVQFDPLGKIRTKDLFSLWAETQLRERYPDLTEYGELPPFSEILRPDDKPIAYPPSRMLRLNFRSSERDEQFQVQRDRAAFYWQHGDGRQKYPGHPHSVEAFLRDFDLMSRFLSERGIGEIRPNQCAMSYNNRLVKGREWNRPEDLANVVTFLSNATSSRPEGNYVWEGVAILRTCVIKNSNNEPMARCYVSLTAADDALSELDLRFVVRGAPNQGRDGVVAFLEAAHDGIVDLFDSLTTPEMHRLWEKL